MILSNQNAYSWQFLASNVVAQHIKYVNHSPMRTKSNKLQCTEKQLTVAVCMLNCNMLLVG